MAAQLAKDSFVGTASSNLSAHTDDIARTWTYVGGGSTTTLLLSGTGSVFPTNSTDSSAVNSATFPTNAPITVSGILNPKTSIGGALMCLVLLDGAGNGYRLGNFNDTWYFQTAGGVTLTSTAGAVPAAGSYAFSIVYNPVAHTFNCTVNGVAMTPVTDSTTAVTNAGVANAGAGGSTSTGQHINTFLVTSPSGSGTIGVGATGGMLQIGAIS